MGDFYSGMDVDDNMSIHELIFGWLIFFIILAIWGMTHGPLEKIYYGGGTHKWECKGCVKNFVTEIYNDPDET